MKKIINFEKEIKEDLEKGKERNWEKKWRAKEKTWDSGMKIVKEITIYIPHRLLAICNKIQEKVGDNEFSILAKGCWGDDGFKLTNDFVIPSQEVGTTYVDYKEDLNKYKSEGYNVVIHSHPFSYSSNFSMNDEESINCHFDASILYSREEFTRAVIKIQISSDTILQLEAKVKIIYDEIEDIDTSNIKKKYYTDRRNIYTLRDYDFDFYY